MGVKGLISYRHRGFYFTLYNHYDSYPSVLGRELVNSIPSNPVDFAGWLERTRDHFEEELRTSPSRGDNHQYVYKPCDDPPANAVSIEWVYTIDLDRFAFSIDNGAHFRLDNIPRGLREDQSEWIEYLALDGKGWRCLKPTTPQEFVADLHPSVQPSARGLSVYEELRPGVIEGSDWMGSSNSVSECGLGSITSKLFRALLNSYYGRLSDMHQYPPEHPKFQGPAEFLLRAAAPGFLCLNIGERSTCVITQSTYTSSDANPIYYWFRGCLIRLSTRLDSKEYLHAAVGETVRRIRQRKLETCTALLWSIRHVCVVHIHKGSVSHSAVVPILAAYGSDDAALDDGIQLLTHYLRPSLAYFEDDAKGKAPMPKLSVFEHRNEVLDVSHREHCNPARPRLPFDVIAEIMVHTDLATYSAFSRVSRASRVLWACRPRIGPYTTLFVPPHQPSSSKSALPNFEKTSGYFAAHDEHGRSVRLHLSYRGRYPDDDMHVFIARTAYASVGKAVYLSLPENVACCSLMTELVADVRNVFYLTEEKLVDRDVTS